MPDSKNGEKIPAGYAAPRSIKPLFLEKDVEAAKKAALTASATISATQTGAAGSSSGLFPNS